MSSQLNVANAVTTRPALAESVDVDDVECAPSRLAHSPAGPPSVILLADDGQPTCLLSAPSCQAKQRQIKKTDQ